MSKKYKGRQGPGSCIHVDAEEEGSQTLLTRDSLREG